MVDKIKRDTEQNWKKAKNFIPKKDEVIIYDCDSMTRIKIGDGITKINDLNFIEEVVPSLNAQYIDDETIILK